MAGVIGEIVTLVGVTVNVAVAVFPPVPVTVRVYVVAAVSLGVGYVPPLTADEVISELPAPDEPMTAVPPEKVGTSVEDVL